LFPYTTLFRSLALNTPDQKAIVSFIGNVARPALEDVAEELTKRGRPASVITEDDSVSLVSPAEGLRDFVYGVQPASHKLPAFSAFEVTNMELRHEARTFFSDGSRGYDVMGMSKEQIIADVLAQFEHYLALMSSVEATLVVGAPEHSQPE